VVVPRTSTCPGEGFGWYPFEGTQPP
jgi:hypothetical protein